MAGHLKFCVTLLMGWAVFKDSLTLLQLSGIVLTLTGNSLSLSPSLSLSLSGVSMTVFVMGKIWLEMATSIHVLMTTQLSLCDKIIVWCFRGRLLICYTCSLLILKKYLLLNISILPLNAVEKNFQRSIRISNTKLYIFSSKKQWNPLL